MARLSSVLLVTVCCLRSFITYELAEKIVPMMMVGNSTLTLLVFFSPTEIQQ